LPSRGRRPSSPGVPNARGPRRKRSSRCAPALRRTALWPPDLTRVRACGRAPTLCHPDRQIKPPLPSARWGRLTARRSSGETSNRGAAPLAGRSPCDPLSRGCGWSIGGRAS
jgi:hypothetical protein